MGNSIFPQIEKKYGQDGIDYVAFRYHERQSYSRIKQLIANIKQHATLQQQAALEFIRQQRRKLDLEFSNGKNEAETRKKGSILQAEAKTKQKVDQFSGYNNQAKRLDDLFKETQNKFEIRKSEIEKKIREEVMRQQNKSKLKGIKEFDDKPDGERKSIQKDCIKLHPEKAQSIGLNPIEEKITWDNYKKEFDGLFNQQQVQSDGQKARKTVRNNITPGGAPICC